MGHCTSVSSMHIFCQEHMKYSQKYLHNVMCQLYFSKAGVGGLTNMLDQKVNLDKI